MGVWIMKHKTEYIKEYSEASFALQEEKTTLAAEVTDFTPTYLYKF